MRRTVARASTLTDVAGNNEKARALLAWEHQGQRAVVSFSFNATDASALTPAPVLTMTCPCDRTNHSLQADSVSEIATRQANGDSHGRARIPAQW